MNSNIFSFSNKTMDFPQFEDRLVQYRNYRYYLPTSKEVKIFEEIKKLYDNSALHSSIINNLAHLVNGSGLVAGNNRDEKIIQAYNLDDILNRAIFDFVLFGGAYLEIIWNTDHTKIVKINHLKYSHVRIGNYGDDPLTNKEPVIYLHCTDWGRYKKKEITPLGTFSNDPKSATHQIYPILLNNYLSVYPKPYYYSGTRWIQTDIELTKFYLNLVRNNFIPNTIINIPGILEPEQKADFEYVLKQNFAGSEGLKTIVFNTEDPNNKPEIIKFNDQDDGAKYHLWVELVSQEIVSLHNLPSTSLAGIAQPGKLGSTQELKTAQEIYNNTKVYPFRNYFLNAFTEINRYLVDQLSQVKIEDIELSFQEDETPPTFEITQKKQ